MKFLQSKKGDTTELTYNPLFTLIFTAIVVFFLFGYAISWDDSTFLNRNVLANDIGLTIETLQMAPDRVSIDYPKELKDVQIEIDSDKVNIKNIEGGELASFTEFNYVKITGLVVPHIKVPEEFSTGLVKSKPFFLYLSKNGKVINAQTSIFSTQTTAPTQTQTTAPTQQILSISTTNNNWKNEELIVSYYEANKGSPAYKIYNINEETYLADYLCNFLINSPYFYTINNRCAGGNNAKIKPDLSNAILKIIYAFEIPSQKDNGIILYSFDSDKSWKLAQIILKNLQPKLNQLNVPNKNIEIKKIVNYDQINNLPVSLNEQIPGLIITIGYQDDVINLNSIISILNNVINPSLQEYYK